MKLFSIDPGDPFIARLVTSLFDGSLIEGFAHDPRNPLALADVTIYLPTRRAARLLRTTIAERLGPNGAILPIIRPLGEFDEDADALLSGDGRDDTFDLPPPPIEPLARLLKLAPLVDRWRDGLGSKLVAKLGEREEIVMPVSRADTLHLAGELADVIDTLEREETTLDALNGDLGIGDVADWWQVTFDFLTIVTRAWPAMLAEIGRSNPAAHRNKRLKREAARLARDGSRGPVIAAGSTGSIPATAELLKAIARLDKGAVVLPGYDTEMDESEHRVIASAIHAGAKADPTIFSHPQYGLVRLLDRLGAARSDVRRLGSASDAHWARTRLMNTAMLPADLSSRWSGAAIEDGALDGLTLVEAANPREEAQVIAIALRGALERADARVALVTPDRGLARRVASELKRFDIAIADSGGMPLAATPCGDFVLRTARLIAADEVDPPALLSLLKHPLLRLRRDRATARMLGEVMERVVLRGRVGRLALGRLALEPARAEQHAADSPITDDDIEDPAYLKHRDAILSLLDDLDALTSEAIAGWDPALPLSGAITRLVVLVEALAGDADGDIAALYADEAGDVLARHLRGIIADGETFAVARADLPDVLSALFTGQTVKPKVRGEARVEIWGTLEARLQSVDLMVVGGLNEGAWPGAAQTGAFLSRTMGQSIGLEPPERRVGQSAHDFAMALGAPDVILTRAKRSGTEPAIRSRWLERLMALLGEDRARPMLQRGEALRQRAGLLEASAPVAFASRPSPRPPVEHRPRSYSVTDIETLRRDAYAVYAKKVLKLRPLPPLLSDPTSRERGLLYHSIMARVLRSVPPFGDPRCEARLTDVIDAVIAEAELPPDIALLWRQRFGRIVPQLIAAEREIETSVARHHLEIWSDRIPITPSGTRIRGIADRIDETSDGLLIIDYKTGGVPSQKDIVALEHPQLPLEAALVRRGAFAEVAWQGADRTPLPITDLIHIRLGSRGEYKWTSVRPKADIDALAEEAWSRAMSLVAHHEMPETGFVSRGNPLKSRRYQGDYDHLARILEWSAGRPDADGDGDGDGDGGFDD